MTQTPKAPQNSRTLKWMLGLSLALNLVFIGFLIGVAWRVAGSDVGPRAMGPAAQNYGAPFVRALPREARRALHRKLRSQASGLPSRAERRALYLSMIDALRSDPFDPAQIEALFAAQADGAERVQRVAQEGWLDLVTRMSEADRLAVADRLAEAIKRRGKPPDTRP